MRGTHICTVEKDCSTADLIWKEGLNGCNKVKDIKTVSPLTDGKPRIRWLFSSKGEKAPRLTEEVGDPKIRLEIGVLYPQVHECQVPLAGTSS